MLNALASFGTILELEFSIGIVSFIEFEIDWFKEIPPDSYLQGHLSWGDLMEYLPWLDVEHGIRPTKHFYSSGSVSQIESQSL